MMVSLTKQELARIRRENARIRNENQILRCTLRNLERNPYMECRDVLTAIARYCDERYGINNDKPNMGPPWVCPEECDCEAINMTGNACPEEGSEEAPEEGSEVDNKEVPEEGPYTGVNIRLNRSANACTSQDLDIRNTYTTYPSREDRPKRVGAGCGGGICGGYTPSGWNRLKLLGAMDHKRDCLTDVLDSAEPGTSRPEARGTGKASTKVVSEGPSADNPCQFRPSVRLLGEMAFQLERRILDYVFGVEGSKKRRFYGYTVSNICYMMEKESTCPDGLSDVVSRTEMTCRLRKIVCALEKYGYDIKVHADFSQEVINKYGLLPCPPDEKTIASFGLNDACTIACLISRLTKRNSEIHNLNILLNSLNFLSKCDGRPLFVW